MIEKWWLSGLDITDFRWHNGVTWQCWEKSCVCSNHRFPVVGCHCFFLWVSEKVKDCQGTDMLDSRGRASVHCGNRQSTWLQTGKWEQEENWAGCSECSSYFLARQGTEEICKRENLIFSGQNSSRLSREKK